LAWLLFKQAGVVSFSQALQHMPRAAIRHRLSRGEWQRVFHSILVTTPGLMTMVQQWQAAVLVAGEGAVLAGLAAAQAGGLRGKFRRAIVDVLVPTETHGMTHPKALLREMSMVKVHRTTLLDRDQVQNGQPPHTVMPRSVVDAAQWALDDDEARLIVASACQQRRVLPSEVVAALKVQRRAKRAKLIRETAEYAEGGATTITEIDLVKLCVKHRLPKPDMQVLRKDASGRNRYLDAYWKEQKLHVEVDGAHHMEVRHWTADMLRQNEVWLEGDRVLRFPAHLIKTRPELVIEQIRKALTGR
jgi:very-short-patch-repair endonuclease